MDELRKKRTEPPTTISIVTPCRNAEALVGDTIRSVLSQNVFTNGRARPEYWLIDGASTDRTVDIARSKGGDHIRIISEPDLGMYDALAKGLERATGSVCYYINAGDLLAPSALDAVLDIFEELPEVNWLSGFHTYYNARGQGVGCRLAYRYRTDMIQAGVHGSLLPSIQQESTFWKGSLTQLIDLDRLRGFRLAGDAYIWRTFSERYSLDIAAAQLGGFRYHGGHLSDDKDLYQEELRSFSRRRTVLHASRARLEWPVWKAPDRIKFELNPSIISYNRKRDQWGRHGDN